MASNTNTDKRCVLAYTSMYIEPDGKIRPCCIAGDFEDELNFNDYDTIPEIYNSPQMRSLRKSMEDGDPLSVCDICFKGNNTLMPYWNENWKHKLQDPNLSDENQNVKSLDYLDARFSNICNFKCRMCGPGLSSSWEDDFIAIKGERGKRHIDEMTMIHADPVSKFTAEDLQKIEHMNVGGGEPWITSDFWKLIDSFTDEQKSQITMYVNTNGSVVKFKGESIMDKLVKFKQVVIGVSCDGFGKIVEYQRTGFKQERFDKNFSHMVDYCKDKDNLILTLEYTITNMNAFHLQDFIFYIKDKWPEIGYEGIHAHWATTPKFYAPALAPYPLKKDIIEYFKKIRSNPRKDGIKYNVGKINEYTTNYSSNIDQSIDSFLDHMHNADIEAIKKLGPNLDDVDPKHFHDILDQRREENWKDVVPHMAPIINKYLQLI